MDRKSRTSPDGESRPTGSSDPYLGDLVNQRDSGGLESTCPGSPEPGSWDGSERRGDGVSCYDPYLDGLTRTGRSGDF